MAPSVAGLDPIPLGAAATAPGEALGTFLKALFTSRNQWQAGDRVNVRLSASYSYEVVAGGWRCGCRCSWYRGSRSRP